MDFDHQFIPAHKHDTKYSYKQDFGYFPGWVSVVGIIVSGESRNGNANVKFHQLMRLVAFPMICDKKVAYTKT